MLVLELVGVFRFIVPRLAIKPVYSMCVACSDINRCFISSPTVASTLHHLSAVYRSQGKTEEAETLESYAQKSKQKVKEYV